jgi:hypothetical protein
MKFILDLAGTNNGGKFLEKYIGQEVEINSLYKDIDINSPPLAILKTNDSLQHSVQLIDIRLIDEYIYVQCFAIHHDDKHGGKALLKLKPSVDLANIINP